jgi:hypothetical protein
VQSKRESTVRQDFSHVDQPSHTGHSKDSKDSNSYTRTIAFMGLLHGLLQMQAINGIHCAPCS